MYPFLRCLVAVWCLTCLLAKVTATEPGFTGMCARLQADGVLGPALTILDDGTGDQNPATNIVTFDETWGEYRVQGTLQLGAGSCIGLNFTNAVITRTTPGTERMLISLFSGQIGGCPVATVGVTQTGTGTGAGAMEIGLSAQVFGGGQFSNLAFSRKPMGLSQWSFSQSAASPPFGGPITFVVGYLDVFIAEVGEFITLPTSADVTVSDTAELPPSAGDRVLAWDLVFDDEDWCTLKTRDVTPGEVGTVVAMQVTDGGNPGERREVLHTFIASPDASGGIVAFHWLKDPYDPTVGGVAESLTYTFDLKFEGGTSGTSSVSYRPAIKQGELFFNLGGSEGLAPARGPGGGEPGEWISYEFRDIPLEKFGFVDPCAPFYVGYATNNGTERLEEVRTRSSIDNFKVVAKIATVAKGSAKPAGPLAESPAAGDDDAVPATVHVGDCSIYPHSGENRFDRVDLEIPGRGDIDFVFRRRYRSQILYNGPLGHNWDYDYNERLVLESAGSVTRANGRGRTDVWMRNPDGSFTAPQGFFGTLILDEAEGYILREPGGFKRIYDGATGRLLAHEDRYGNRMDFEHSESGHLERVIDAYGRAVEFFYEGARLSRIRDFAGREVVYTYDGNGDLVTVRTPVVVDTSTGNDFPQGRTEMYGYASGFDDPNLDHNMVELTRPEEIAAGGEPSYVWTYGIDLADPLTYDRVLNEDHGGTNASGVTAGGTTTFEYERLNPDEPLGDPRVPRLKATVTDRAGNATEYFFNDFDEQIRQRRLTRGLRAGEPEAYETTFFYDEDSQLVRTVLPEGNEVRMSYDRSGPRAAQRNVVEIRRIADAARGGGEDVVTTMIYDPLYNDRVAITGPRGNAAGYEPPIGQASAERYTTRYVCDYQEGTNEIPDAARFGIDLSGVPRGLGDVNGDGRTDQTAGNFVRILSPSVELLPDSKEAERLGSSTQEIVTDLAWNDHGQLLWRIDPEGNVTVREYYPADDPDGDGMPVDQARASDASGYLMSVTVDALDSPRRVSDAAPVALETHYGYDPVGNVVRVRNPRGVVTEIEVNQLNEPVRILRGSDVTVARESGQLITGEDALRYETRLLYDHNGRVVAQQVENRDSNTEGVGDFVERTYTYDILDNLIERTVEVDAETTLTWRYAYNPNELIELTVEPESNRHRTVYDERNLPFLRVRGDGSEGASTTRIDYDLNAKPVRLVDAEDNDGDGEPESTVLGYDGFDRLVSVTDALGNEALTEYDPASNIVRSRVFGHPPGRPGEAGVRLSDLRYSIDELNRTFQIDEELFVSDGFEPARPVDLRDENSDGFVTTRLEHDRSSRRTLVMEDDLEATRIVFDGADRPIERLDAAGNRTIVSYDQNSNPVRVEEHEVSPEGLVPDEVFATLYVYDQLDRLVRTTDNLGQTTRFSWDSRDNLVGRSDPEGAAAADPLDLFPGDINAAGNSVSWFHDGLDRTILEVLDLREDGVGGGALDFSNPVNPDGQITVAYEYDGNSRLVGIVDDNGYRTAWAYDALNRLTSQLNADGNEYRVTYDRDDNRTEIVDPNGSVVTSMFDALDRLVERSIERASGVGGTTRETYAYDGLGRPTAWTDDNGLEDEPHRVERVYDSLSRVLEERQTVPRGEPATGGFVRADANADGSVDVSDPSFTLAWLFTGGDDPPCLDAADSNGDGAIDLSDAVRTLLHLFGGGAPPGAPFPDCGSDSMSQLGCASPTCAVPPEGGADDLYVGVVSAVYSGDGRRLNCTYPGGRVISNTFDEIDRIVTTSDASGAIAESSWIGPGYRELRRVCRNGTTLSFLDDAGGADAGYDGVRRIVRLRCLLPDGVTAFLDREYGYNRANVRTFEKRNDDFALTDRYTFDSAYRIARTELDQDGLGGASPRDAASIEYLVDGVSSRRKVDTTLRAGGASSVELSVNEMNEYSTVGGSTRVHDENGNLVDDEARRYVFDYRNRLVAVYDSEERPIAKYTYHADGRRARKTVYRQADPVVVERQTVFFYDGARVCEERDGTSGASDAAYVWSPVYIDELVQIESAGRGVLYAHQNARADVVALTDAGGSVVETYRYDDFGNVENPGSAPNPYLFQGRRYDAETGLYYFRHRYYDPRTGRFLQRDPLGLDETASWYGFPRANAVAMRDPLGLQGEGPEVAGGGERKFRDIAREIYEARVANYEYGSSDVRVVFDIHIFFREYLFFRKYLNYPPRVPDNAEEPRPAAEDDVPQIDRAREPECQKEGTGEDKGEGPPPAGGSILDNMDPRRRVIAGVRA